MNYTHNRSIALRRTPGPISAYLLTCFPDLVAMEDEVEPAYCDISFAGLTMATWKEAELLHMLVKHAKPKHVLEIGTAVGWTAAHMATALGDDGDIACVDPFTENARGLGECNLDVLARLYGNMDRADVIDKYAIHVAESPAILSSIAPEGGWDLVFLDSWQHDGQPLKDIQGVLPLINPKTIIVMHDFHVSGVKEAAEFLTKLKTEEDVQQWHFTGFFTRFSIAVFMQGVWQKKGGNKYPRWWDAFNKDVSRTFKQAGE